MCYRVVLVPSGPCLFRLHIEPEVVILAVLQVCVPELLQRGGVKGAEEERGEPASSVAAENLQPYDGKASVHGVEIALQ